jgi:DNA-binding beta-propeller fold protein YncE
MKNSVIICLFLVAFASCSKMPEVPLSHDPFGGGVYILNEGNFMAGNGSLSFYSYDSSKVFNDLFYSINNRHLGDVPNSMVIHADKAYIVVNNSGKIEVVDRSTLVSTATITGLISPRNMAIINDNKAYVTSMYSDSIVIIDLTKNKISGYVNIRRSSESIVLLGLNAYVSNWVGGKEIMVLNTVNDEVIDSVGVGIEPESMVLDAHGKLWVLCNGGWARTSAAELDVINTGENFVEKKFVFPSLGNSPTSLTIDGFGLNLYYLDKGVWQIQNNSEALATEPIITESGAYFYKIAINPMNSDIFVTDAADFVQKGNILIYKNNGVLVTKQQAGIIPGSMCFNLTYKK